MREGQKETERERARCKKKKKKILIERAFEREREIKRGIYGEI